MKRSATIFLFLLLLCAQSVAQTNDKPFKGVFKNNEHGVTIQLNLYTPQLEAPGMSFLGKLHGYMHGRIYGMWLLTSHTIENNTATLRFSNDQGSDAQTIRFTQINDSIFQYEAIDGNEIKKVQGRKLVKIPGTLQFKRTAF